MSPSRPPHFLGVAAASPSRTPSFAEAGVRREKRPAWLAEVAPPPAPAGDPVPPEPEEAQGPRPTVPMPAPVMDHARLQRGLEVLAAAGDALAAQLATDALEYAVEIAKRILERELSQDPAALESLVISAVRRAGDAQRLTVKVCPDDLFHLTAAPSFAPSVAKFDLQADPSLQPGDVVVDAGTHEVDGRLATRIARLREALSGAL